ncbi:hypothetical protein TWF481_003636 [Arthrobotrys musiformis]|uniref:BZIP domain-containing protein n=1 Tax=Arthrobotrys musiformis TaxID=47236 RepID=A0AAV9WJ64_9PEZI
MSNLTGEVPAGAVAKAPQPRKRRKLTEKRRAQNREAQRLFRERKRKKVFEALQQSNDPEYWNNQSNLSTDHVKEAGTENSVETGVDANPGARLDTPISTNISNEQAINEAARELYNYDVDYAREKQAGRNLSMPRLISLHWLLNDPNDPAPTPDTISEVYDNLPPSNTLNSFGPGGAESGSQAMVDIDIGETSRRYDVPASTATIDELSGSLPVPDDDVTEIPRPLSLAHPAGFFASTQVQEACGGYTLQEIIEAGLEALSSKDHQLDIRLSRGQETRAQDQRKAFIEDIGTKALEELLIYTPSPCRTHMNLHEITTFKAVVINAKIIGFWNPLPEDFKDPYKSPFVQAYFLNDQSVEKVKEKFADTPEGLRPSELQCRTPHKAYIDVFPFPGFREKVITAASGGFFNEIEFCVDLGKSALMCWGSGQGKYGGEPWNPRSWEAQPWFIKKWGALIDDELKECSRFWRELRDEDKVVPNSQWSSFTPTVLLD